MERIEEDESDRRKEPSERERKSREIVHYFYFIFSVRYFISLSLSLSLLSFHFLREKSLSHFLQTHLIMIKKFHFKFCSTTLKLSLFPKISLNPLSNIQHHLLSPLFWSSFCLSPSLSWSSFPPLNLHFVSIFSDLKTVEYLVLTLFIFNWKIFPIVGSAEKRFKLQFWIHSDLWPRKKKWKMIIKRFSENSSLNCYPYFLKVWVKSFSEVFIFQTFSPIEHTFQRRGFLTLNHSRTHPSESWERERERERENREREKLGEGWKMFKRWRGMNMLQSFEFQISSPLHSVETFQRVEQATVCNPLSTQLNSNQLQLLHPSLFMHPFTPSFHVSFRCLGTRKNPNQDQQHFPAEERKGIQQNLETFQNHVRGTTLSSLHFEDMEWGTDRVDMQKLQKKERGKERIRLEGRKNEAWEWRKNEAWKGEKREGNVFAEVYNEGSFSPLLLLCTLFFFVPFSLSLLLPFRSLTNLSPLSER